MDSGFAAIAAAVIAAIVAVVGYLTTRGGLNRIEKLSNVIEKLAPGDERSEMESIRSEFIAQYARRNRRLAARILLGKAFFVIGGTVLFLVLTVVLTPQAPSDIRRIIAIPVLVIFLIGSIAGIAYGVRGAVLLVRPYSRRE